MHMSQSSETPRFIVSKSSGITESERYLEWLCERNFLSLWSYPRPFRDQGGNKELCDLLVIIGKDVIVFSDKHCLLTPKTTLEVDWNRWFRAAIKEGANQAWGAERWLRQHPGRVFLDSQCTQPLPVPLPPSDQADFHLVVTVHGVAHACRAMLGGSGSLILNSNVRGLDAHNDPFVIGDLEPARSFVHVFDDTTMEIVMSTLDTAADLLRYLREKERLFRSRGVLVAGEENLLALYLSRVDDSQTHAFVLDSDKDLVVIDDSWWLNFEASDERRAQVEHDAVSYTWDRLIERFAVHALEGTQYFATEPFFASSEIILRFMAAEPRLRRRYLSDAFMEALAKSSHDQRFLRVVPRQYADEPMYVFLFFPWWAEKSDAENRLVRRNYLEFCMRVAKLKFPNAVDIVGIATESGIDREARTEDAIYLDAREWNEEAQEEARRLQSDFDILTAAKQFGRTVDEYPVLRQTSVMAIPKNPRNKPCPCGSGRKYKTCHGR